MLISPEELMLRGGIAHLLDSRSGFLLHPTPKQGQYVLIAQRGYERAIEQLALDLRLTPSSASGVWVVCAGDAERLMQVALGQSSLSSAPGWPTHVS